MKPNYCSGDILNNSRLSNPSYSSSTCRGTKSKVGTHHTHHAYSTSPYIVYRSAKYDGPHARAVQIFRGYAKYYIVLPVTLIARQCKDAFYQLCGLLLLLITSPIWILMIIGLFIMRRLRFILIQKLYPNCFQLEDCASISSTTDSYGVVNSIVWTKGKLNVHTLQKKFKTLCKENPNLHQMLKLRKVSKYGLHFWENCEDFIFESHIVEAPKRFNDFPIMDEPLKEHYRTGSATKSVLQKYVSYCVSNPLDFSSPPWKIHVVQYIARDDGVKEKTCLVIRMHVALIRNREVKRALSELFLTSVSSLNSEEIMKSDTPANEPILENTESNKLVGFFVRWRERYQHVLNEIKEECLSYQNNLKIWLTLRLKQLEYHSKTVALSMILVDIRNALKRCLCNLEVTITKFFRNLTYYAVTIVTNFQGLSSMPIIILSGFMKRRQFKRLGLQKSINPDKKLISWSDLIFGDLAQEISEKAGTISPESVILMACSYALNDYYQQINIANPKKLGFTIGNALNPLQSSIDVKPIYIPCNVKANPHNAAQELRDLEDRIDGYPDWKLLGFLYVFKYSNYFLPECLARSVRKSIVSGYPFSFTNVNLKSENTNMQQLSSVCQLYGEFVEDFTFWPFPPVPNFGVSVTLVQYTGKTRLFVMSPFKSMDTVLTHRCNQYLIQLAEDVGVDRNKIPYSRRSSPSSTCCPSPLPSYVNGVDNIGFRSTLRRSDSLVSTTR